jgi:hypothetical protein
VDFITTTPVFKFSVHTARAYAFGHPGLCDLAREHAFRLLLRLLALLDHSLSRLFA